MIRNRAANVSVLAALLAAAIAGAPALAAQEAAAGPPSGADAPAAGPGLADEGAWAPLDELGADSGGIELAGVIEAGFGIAAGEGLAFEDPAWKDGGLGFALTMEARPAEGLRAYVELSLDENLPAAAPIISLGMPNLTLESPRLTLAEAWASLQDAPLPGTELRLGRQRIAWGPADQIGIVDAFDVPDFSDLSAFGAKLASDALRLRYFGQRFGIDLAWTPFWRAAPMPESVPAAMMPAAAVAIPGMTVTPTTLVLETPENGAYESSTCGARATFEPALWTFGASYVYGRSPTPALTEVVVTPTGPGTATVSTRLAYPRRHEISLDLAGELLGIGVWGEAQYVIPQRDYVLDLTGLGQSRTTTPDDPYFRWLAGCDYTFSNDMYLNFQYLRGMGWENLPDAQNDYAMLAFKWETAGGRFVIGPLAAVIEVDALGDIVSGDREFSGSYGCALSPSVTYKPYDGVELTVGMAWLFGADATTLGSMAEESALSFSTKLSF